jgi:hypothetical protein
MGNGLACNDATVRESGDATVQNQGADERFLARAGKSFGSESGEEQSRESAAKRLKKKCCSHEAIWGPSPLESGPLPCSNLAGNNHPRGHDAIWGPSPLPPPIGGSHLTPSSRLHRTVQLSRPHHQVRVPASRWSAEHHITPLHTNKYARHRRPTTSQIPCATAGVLEPTSQPYTRRADVPPGPPRKTMCCARQVPLNR